jgi:hypothetical protein
VSTSHIRQVLDVGGYELAKIMADFFVSLFCSVFIYIFLSLQNNDMVKKEIKSETSKIITMYINKRNFG